MNDKYTATRVWDLPTRLVHWLLVGLFAFSWWSAENGELAWHRLSGYAVLTLLLFRLAWGFAGSDSARFAVFVAGPRAVLAYARQLLRRPATPLAGHNPMGGWSVLGLLLLLLVQTGSGLFSVDVDGLESGPLSHRVSFSTGRAIAELHELSFNVLLVLLGLHLAAMLFYRVYHGENLVTAMFSGRKRVPPQSAATLRFAGLPRALALLVLAALLVAALVGLA